LGPLRDNPETIMGPFWDHLAPFWDHCGTIARPRWDNFGTNFGPLGYHLGIEVTGRVSKLGHCRGWRSRVRPLGSLLDLFGIMLGDLCRGSAVVPSDEPDPQGPRRSSTWSSAMGPQSSKRGLRIPPFVEARMAAAAVPLSSNQTF